jgi:hypothetical protein
MEFSLESTSLVELHSRHATAYKERPRWVFQLCMIVLVVAVTVHCTLHTPARPAGALRQQFGLSCFTVKSFLLRTARLLRQLRPRPLTALRAFWSYSRSRQQAARHSSQLRSSSEMIEQLRNALDLQWRTPSV